MAKDIQSKERKASVPEVAAEKVKKVKNVVAAPAEAPAKKRKATDDAAPVNVKKSKTPKPVLKKAPEVKVAEPADEATKKSTGTTTSKDVKKGSKKEARTGKKVNGTSEEPAETAVAPTPSKAATISAKKGVSNNQKKVLTLVPEIEVDEGLDSGLEGEEKGVEEDSDSEVDDQTLALLKGFESDGDEEHESNGEGLPEGAPVPVRKELSKKEEKKLKKIAEAGASDKPGVIYIGRIPHGFYENEMKAYFKQFGNILKLRMSRNKHTGASKHYAWIQFESATVADIVARTMDNYLMFGHLLKVKFIPDEQVNPDWFKGANKRFKKVPWNKMAGRKLAQGQSEEKWNERVEREVKRRDEMANRLKEIGYEFDAPKVKSATGVAKAKAPEEITNGESEIKAIEAGQVVGESSKPKKKGKKAKADDAAATESVPSKVEKKEHRAVVVPPTKEDVEESLNALIAEAAEKPKKKLNKAKGVKEVELAVEEIVTVVEDESVKPKAKKEKKTKKEKSDVPVPEVVSEVPEEKIKTKKSKAALVETSVTPVEASEEKVKKAKKSKKEKLVV